MHSVTNTSGSVNLPSFVASEVRNDLQHEIAVQSKAEVARGRVQIDLSDFAVGERRGSLFGRVNACGQTKLVTVIQTRSRQVAAAYEAPKTLHREHLRIVKPEPPRRRLAQR